MKPGSLALLVGAAALASCGSAPSPEDSRATIDPLEGQARSTAATTVLDQVVEVSDDPLTVATEPADRRWSEFDSVIETDGIPTQNGADGEPRLSVVASTSSGFIAAGTFGGGLAVWRSDDLSVFEPVYSEVCCDRHIRPESIAEIDGTLLLGGSGEVRGADLVERTFLLRSDDGGTSWTTIEDPAFERADVLARVVVVDGAVIVEQSDQSGNGTPLSASVRSVDLVDWAPLALPGSVAQDWPFLVDDGETLFAVSTRYDDDEGASVNSAVWSSNDGGATFIERPPLDRLGGGGYVVADESLVQLPETSIFETGHAEPEGLLRLDPGGAWNEEEPDVGQWGDGSTRIGIGARNTATGRFYAVGSRTIRASAHYCYEDDVTCHQREASLMSTVDGSSWNDVVGPEFGVTRAGQVMVTDDGEIVIWTIAREDTSIEGFRWRADEPPGLVDPAAYPPPSIPVPLLEFGDPFPVGAVARVVFGAGGCGGALQIDDRRWEAEDLPDQIPDSWPYREVFQEDGVAGYVYARIERTGDDEIVFSIEGIGAVAIFRPAPSPEGFCG